MLKDHNAVTPVKLKPADPRSQVKNSTTEPLRKGILHSYMMQNGSGNYDIDPFLASADYHPLQPPISLEKQQPSLVHV